MAQAQDPAEGMVMARIVIERTLQPNGIDLVSYIACDAEGLTIPMIETLGMLEMAKDGLLRIREEETDAGDDEGEGS